MKKIASLAAVLSLLAILPCAFGQDPGHLFLGANWFLDPKPQHLPCDSTISVYHTGFDYNSDTAWFHGLSSSSKLIFMDSVVNRYASAQRMMYQARLKPSGFDPLYYYLQSRDTTLGDTVSIGDRHYWRIDSGSHSDLKVLWDNEYAGSWWTVYGRPGPFKLVAKLRVSNLPLITDPNKDEPVISIIFKGHFATGSVGDSMIALDTFNIAWSSFGTANHDTVMFMPDSIALPFDLKLDQSAKSNAGGIEIEVHSKRYVTAYLEWVCVEEVDADALLGGVQFPGLDPTNPSKVAASRATRDSIDSAVVRVQRKLGSKLMRFYVADEPTRSCFAAMGYFGDSILSHGIVTEYATLGDSNYLEFVAQTHPDIWWRYTGGVGGGVCAYANTGLNSGLTPSLHPYDTTHAPQADWYYRPSTRLTAGNIGFGYFPFDSSGTYVTDSAVAMGDTCSLDHVYVTDVNPLPWGGPDTLGQYKFGFDRSWDMFDYSRMGTCNALGYAIRKAAQTMNIVRSTIPGHPTAWWMDNINESVLDLKGFHSHANPPVPEQYSAALNMAWSFGARGALFYLAVTALRNNKPPFYGPSISFYDDSCHHETDSITYNGHTAISMFKHNGTFIDGYGHWLRTWGDSMYQGTYLGGFARCGIESIGLNRVYQGIVSETTSVGTIDFIDPTQDSSSRPILTHWVHSDDDIDANLTDSAMSKDLCWVTYGAWDPPDPQTGVKMLLITNLWCDPRNMRSRFVTDADSALNHWYRMRGERTVFTKLALPQTISEFWSISRLDDVGGDTIVRYNDYIRNTLFPGEGRLLRIAPAYGGLAGNGSIPLNNGRRAEVCTVDSSYWITYVRGDSIFARRTTKPENNYYWGPEIVVAPDSAHWNAHWHAPRNPSLRMIRSPYDEPNRKHNRSAVGVTYAVTDDSLQKKVIMFAVVASDSLGGLDMPRYQGVYGIWNDTVATFAEPTPPIDPCPVLAPFNQNDIQFGAVIAWADRNRIAARSVAWYAAGGWQRSAVRYVTAPRRGNNTDTVAEFPSIIEETDTLPMPLTTSSKEKLGLAFRQWHQIYFVPLTAAYVNDDSAPLLATGVIRHLSVMTAADCENNHPCVDVGTVYYRVTGTTPQLRTTFFVSWDAFQNIPTYDLVGPMFRQTRYVWRAMGEGTDWSYTTFGSQPAMFTPTLVLDLEYPSNRGYDGAYDSAHVAPATYGLRSERIAMQTTEGHVIVFSDSNRHFDNQQWKGRRITASDNHYPNLEIRAHDSTGFLSQHAVKQDGGGPALLVVPLNQQYGSTSLAGTGMTFSYHRTASNDTDVCYHADRIWNAKARGSNPAVLPLHAPIPSQDSLAFSQGVGALSMPLHATTPADTVVVAGIAWTTDSAAAATWMGSTGSIVHYLEAALVANDSVVATLDSCIVTPSTLGIRKDTMRHALGTWSDSSVRLRIRVHVNATSASRTESALLVGTLDTADGGFAKSAMMQDRGRADMVPIGRNAIDLVIYPSPARPRARVMYTVPVEDADDPTEVLVFDLRGRDVMTLVEAVQQAGRHTAEFNASELRSGQYVIAVHTRSHMASRMIGVVR